MLVPLQAATSSLHIGVFPAMSGISRFLKADRGWRYGKVSAARLGVELELAERWIQQLCRHMASSKPAVVGRSH